MSSTESLFKPFNLGNLALNNRIVMAPMTRSFSPGNVPNSKVVDYYRRRAEGGVGLIVTEGTCIGHKAATGYPNVPFIAGEEPLAGWKKVVDAVHAAGGKLRLSFGMWVAFDARVLKVMSQATAHRAWLGQVKSLAMP